MPVVGTTGDKLEVAALTDILISSGVPNCSSRALGTCVRQDLSNVVID